MDRARVVVLELPRLVQEIVEHAVGGQPDMEIVADLPTAPTLPAALAEARADVVISGAEHGCAALSELLGELPRLKLLAVSDDARNAVLYELRPTRTPLGEVSPQTIVDAIRSARRAAS